MRNLPPESERCCPPAATAATINPQSDARFSPAQDTLPTVRRSRTDTRGMENMVVPAEAAKIAEAAAIVEAEVVKSAAGAAASKIKVARVPNPAIRPLAPTAISV